MTFAERKGFEERNQIIRRHARSPICDFGLRYFSMAEATGKPEATWQPFQIRLMNDRHMFVSQNKSRQIGASCTMAGKALLDILLKPRPYTVITTSINMEEAKEKILYAKLWYEARCKNPSIIPIAEEFNDYGDWIGVSPNRITHYPEIVRASAFEIQFSNGGRFISHPSRPPRGKAASVILDEFHHIQQARAIYQAAVPMITRGRGANWISIHSTPRGAQGTFWEIHTNSEGKFNNYSRHDDGWWEISDLCSFKDMLQCRLDFQSGMDPELMLRRYGTDMAHILFGAVLLEDWQQEYCLAFLDSAYSFIPWELIWSCHPAYYIPNLDIETGTEFIEDQDPDEVAAALERCYIGYSVRGWDKALDIIRLLSDHVDRGEIESEFILGYDCGRHRDNAEISIIGVRAGLMFQRAIITMPQTEFEKQQTIIAACMTDLPVKRMIMDRGGMGEQISEWAERRWGGRVIPVVYTNELKSEWAIDLKLTMQERKLTLIPDRDQDSQLHSIQRKATQTGLIQYVVTEETSILAGGKKVVHHADKFWATATAVSLAKEFIGHGGGNNAPRSQGGGRTAPKVVRVLNAKGFRGTVKEHGRGSSGIFGKVGRRGSGPAG